MTATVIQTSRITLKRSVAPPSKRMYDEPKIRINWFSSELAAMSTQPKPVGPTAMPASRKITTSGTLVSRARRPLTVPSIRMSPKTIIACLACSIDTADSMRGCPFGSHPCRRAGGCRWPVATGAAVYRERSAAGLRGQGDPPGSRGEPSTAKARQGVGGPAGSGRIPRVLAGGERSGGVDSVVVGEAGGTRADCAAGLAAAIEIAPILTASARHAAVHNRNTFPTLVRAAGKRLATNLQLIVINNIL